MSNANKTIDAIIFDLGHVIVEINHKNMIAAFADIFHVSPLAIKKLFQKDDYILFEMGKLSEQEFFLRIKTHFNQPHIDDDKIKKAWDSMILQLPLEGIHALQELKKNYLLFALSNTNCSHIKQVNINLANQHKIENLTALFHQVYYSHELGLCKPDTKIYEHVIQENNLIPERTLFIDDNRLNIEGAMQVKLQTLFLRKQSRLVTELNQLGLL